VSTSQLELSLGNRGDRIPLSTEAFIDEIVKFEDFGKSTEIFEFPDENFSIPVLVNEFWTSKQRAAHSIHGISYRACFKPQLPRFYISRLTACGETVYDPFLGRGTTAIEAGLLGRRGVGCDINPLSRILVAPRFAPPQLSEVQQRLATIDLESPTDVREDLLVFYHRNTLSQITMLRSYLLERDLAGTIDHIDEWIRMVATNRLTGHSPGFFSVYTLPPNQAVSITSQARINERREQIPPNRDVRTILLRKTKSLLSKLVVFDLSQLEASGKPHLITGSSDSTPQLQSDSVALVVTSPPFLDTVDYQSDNWLRCWFNDIDAQKVPIWQLKKPADWQEAMTRTFRELRRVLRPGGRVAFEVGEVRNGKILLEALVVPAAADAGLVPIAVMINDQVFTKTSNAWGVENLKKGTNTNRIVLLEKR
jgi:SAM-dependent methyltransferase